jgi:hypothetical protein
MSAPRIAPDYVDPEAGRGQVYDPARSRASSSGTAVSVEGAPPKSVMATGLFSPTGIYSSLTRKLKGSRRTRKKGRKTRKTRKSRR